MRPPICPQLYVWAKANPRHAEIVKEFWGPHRRRRGVPKSLEGGEVPRVFKENLEYPLYEKTLFRIKNVTMRGAEGVIFLPDGSVSHQTSWKLLESVTATKVYKNKWKGPEVFKNGNYSTLILYWGGNYYHWFNDVLPMLFGAVDLMPKDTIFIMKRGLEHVYKGDFYLKSLHALGIGRDRVVEFDGTESWTLENFWWQPPAVNTGNQTPGAMQWIGKQISSSIEIKTWEKPVRVYISRQRPFYRVVSNEEDIIPLLEQAGFKICRLEDMLFEEQVRLFRNAEMVMGAHGAGFTNLIFSPKGTRVVEFLAKGHERSCYWSLCEELEHEYRFFLGEPEWPEERRSDTSDPGMNPPDIRIDLPQLVRVLNSFAN